MKIVKILSFLPMVALVIVLTVGCSKFDTGLQNQISSYDLNGVKITGNGAPSGTHYNLNIIGVKYEKDIDLISGGHVIFVPLVGRTKIKLAEGDYAVLDKNATDGEGAFQLPNPDPDNDGVTVYSVWARALGKPGGKATMQTAAWDVGLDGELGTADDILVYSMYKLEVERGHGKQVFSDVSRYLLYIYVEEDIIGDPDGVPDSGDEVLLVEAGRYPLFDPALEDYFWEYDNNGLKLLQLRFYEVSVTVPAS
jgi:hypothetical protein